MVSSFDYFPNACMVYKNAFVAAFHILLSVVKMLLKGEVGGRALNSHRNYIVDHGKSLKNHGIMILNFCGNPGKCSFPVFVWTMQSPHGHLSQTLTCHLLLGGHHC